MRVVQHSASELHYKFSSHSCATTTTTTVSLHRSSSFSLPLSTLSYQSHAHSATLLPVLNNIDGDSCCCCCCQCLLRQSIESALCSVSASGDSDSDRLSTGTNSHICTGEHTHSQTFSKVVDISVWTAPQQCVPYPVVIADDDDDNNNEVILVGCLPMKHQFWLI